MGKTGRPVRNATLWIVFAWGAVLSGCGDSIETAARPTAVDSAGVRLVTYDGTPEPTHRISLSSEPLLRHGHLEGHHLFQMIFPGALDAEGRPVVFDRPGQALVRIARDGTQTTVLARGGRGPDEVLQVRSIRPWPGGGVMVEDMSNAKLMVLREGEPARSFSTVRDAALSRGLMVGGFDGEGRPLMTTASYNSRFEVPWLQGHLVRLDLAAMTADTVGQYDLAKRRPENGPENAFGSFGRATVAGPEFVTARSDRPSLTWLRADGSVRQVLRWTPDIRYPTPAEWDAFVEFYVEDMVRVNPQMPRADAERFASQQLERYEWRTDEPYPLFSDLRADDEGRIWLGVFDPSGWTNVDSYELIDSDGTWLGRVAMPPGFRPLDIRHDEVLGVLLDSMEVQSVAVYRLRLERLP